MLTEFETSVMGEIGFFISIQINQCIDGVYIHQTKYTSELLNKFDMVNCNLMATPMHLNFTLDKYENITNVDQKAY